jgi:hypothetical protein
MPTAVMTVCSEVPPALASYAGLLAVRHGQIV